MTQELPAIKTKLSMEQMLAGLYTAWLNLFNEAPNKNSIILLLSHGALESGNYNSMWCYNIGNIKSKDGDNRNWCFYKCNELVPLTMGKAMVGSCDKDGGQAIITGLSGNNCWIWFSPKNKYCRFRAFDSLTEGCVDYLSFLKYRYKPETGIWKAVEDGNVKLFCHLLRVNGYYTADETIYTNSVARKFDELLKLKFDWDNLPIVSDAQKEKINSLVQINFDELSKNMELDKSSDSDNE